MLTTRYAMGELKYEANSRLAIAKTGRCNPPQQRIADRDQHSWSQLCVGFGHRFASRLQWDQRFGLIGYKWPIARPSAGLVAKFTVIEIKLEVAQAKTADDRVVALAKLADELHQEMRDIARVDTSGENMTALQQMYAKVVYEGILSQARQVSGTAAEKKATLEQLANRLLEVGKQADELAAEVPQVSVRPLRDVAVVARKGAERIREYMEVI